VIKKTRFTPTNMSDKGAGKNKHVTDIFKWQVALRYHQSISSDGWQVKDLVGIHHVALR